MVYRRVDNDTDTQRLQWGPRVGVVQQLIVMTGRVSKASQRILYWTLNRQSLRNVHPRMLSLE